MSRSAFLALKAVMSIAFSIPLILVPAPLMSLFGANLSETGIFVARLFGVDLLGIGFVCWSSRDSRSSVVSRILLGLFIADGVGLIVMALGQLSGIMNPLGWVNVGVWLFLTLGLGYFRFARTPAN